MDYTVVRRDLPQQPIVSIRDRRPAQALPGFLAEAFGEMYGQLGVLGVGPAGPPFVIYHEFGPELIDAEVAIPISRPVLSEGRVQARVLPAATVASTLHVGPYEALGAAYTAVTDWIAVNTCEAAGPFQERYLNGPDQATPAEYRTEVEVPIVPIRVAVPV